MLRGITLQQKIVRQIYGMFLDGQTPSSIASFLTKQRVPTPAGKEKWQSSMVKSILTNEKYKGDALLQRTFTVDFLSKKLTYRNLSNNKQLASETGDLERVRCLACGFFYIKVICHKITDSTTMNG